VSKVWADQGYSGAELFNWVFAQFRCVLEVVKKKKGQRGFEVLPRRWVVERTLAWLVRSRRLSKDYERKPSSSEAQVYLASGRLYSSNTNISFFHSADEFETIRQQGTQFALIFARISEEFLTSGFEFGKRFEVLVVQGFLLEEFPEAFDQIQIRRIGREEYELDA